MYIQEHYNMTCLPHLCLAGSWCPRELCHLSEWNSTAKQCVELLGESDNWLLVVNIVQ